MLSLQATPLISKQFIIPLPQKHTAILPFPTVWIKQTLGNMMYRTGYQTICSHWRWQPNVIRGSSPKVTTSFFYHSPSILECCYCNLILQYSLLTWLPCTDCSPRLVGLLVAMLPPNLHKCSKERTPKLPLSKPWKWSSIHLSNNGLTYNTNSVFGTYSMTPTVLYELINPLTLFSKTDFRS